ncbi:transcription termination/antitermination NusG family protein [Xenorhabdus sp. TS4]|uniref:transcription termination/antitermination NusG family protein n=1 Tax=Xenorhabdus sp. TS4 TaxID=1873483 RepID=UPI001656B516|nr:transcription termination/antitermination NusG family protein [Xenorhabdus sp. TS4]MBC8950058.1 transcriptional activator RfaH [Xenorhabdus sp. TS4]
MERWYLACHKAGKDNVFKAQITLERMNIMAFSPVIRSCRPRSDRPGQFRQVMEQLFPGYLFIFFDPEIHHTSKIELCPGISHLVRLTGEITPIRDSVVDEIMQLPVCSQAFRIKHPGKNSWGRNTTPLNNQQRKQIQSLVEENNGLTRNAMFFAFAEALR